MNLNFTLGKHFGGFEKDEILESFLKIKKVNTKKKISYLWMDLFVFLKQSRHFNCRWLVCYLYFRAIF